MKEAEMKQLALWIVRALRSHDDPQTLTALKQEVEACCTRFPVPGIA
jgi:glycine/serine hydroxymethyltransferase